MNLNISQISILNNKRLNENKKISAKNADLPNFNLRASSLEALASYNAPLAFRASYDSNEAARVKELFNINGKSSVRYRNLLSTYSPMEAALFASFGLSDDQIKEYQDIIGQEAKYKTSSNEEKKYEFKNSFELAYLVKNGFNKQRLFASEYMKLKAQGVTLPSARKDDQKFALTTEEIVKNLNLGKTQEDIANEKRLYNLLAQGMSAKMAVFISKYPDLYEYIIKDEYSLEQIIKFYGFGLTTKAQIEQFNSLTETHSENEAAAIAKNQINDSETISQIEQMIAAGLAPKLVAEITSNPNDLKRYNDFLNFEVSLQPKDLVKWLELGIETQEQWNNFNQLKDKKDKDGNVVKELRRIALLAKFNNPAELYNGDRFIYSDRELYAIANDFSKDVDFTKQLENFNQLKDKKDKDGNDVKDLRCIVQLAKFNNPAELYNGDRLIYSDRELYAIANGFSKDVDFTKQLENFNQLKDKKDKDGDVVKDLRRIVQLAKFNNPAELYNGDRLIYSNRELYAIANGFSIDVDFTKQLENFNQLKDKKDKDGNVVEDLGPIARLAKFNNLAELYDGDRFIYSNLELDAIAFGFSKDVDFTKQLENFNQLKDKKDRYGRDVDYFGRIALLAKFNNPAELYNGDRLIYSNRELYAIANDFSKDVDFTKQLENFNQLKDKKDKDGNELEDLRRIAQLARFNNPAELYNGDRFKYSNDEFDAIIDWFSKDEDFTKQLEKYEEIRSSSLGIKPEIAAKIAGNEKYRKLLEQKRKLYPVEAAFFVTHTSIDSKELSNLPEEVLYKLSTGEIKDLFKLLAKAKREVMGRTTPTADELGLDASKMEDSIVSRFKDVFSYDNGVLTLAPRAGVRVRPNQFEVSITSLIVDGSKVLFVQNNANRDEAYVLYKGAIGIVDGALDNLTDEQEEKLVNSLKPWANVSDKQAKVFAEASKHFPFSLIENDKTIIGAGIAGFDELSIDSSRNEVLRYFERNLPRLKASNQLTAQNILKLIPKGAHLQINPYITLKKKDGREDFDTAISHSISARWITNDGKTVEFRTHSADLRKQNSPKWIYRLGIGDGINNNVKYYYVDEAGNLTTPNPSDSDGNKKTHQEVDGNPYNDSSLISSNLDFQKFMRYLGIQYSGNYENIAKELYGPGVKDKLTEEDIRKIILERCLQDSAKYEKYKGIVEDILEEEGFPNIRMLNEQRV